MKTAAFARKPSQNSERISSSTMSAGAKGVAITPPSYGILTICWRKIRV